MSQEFTSLKPHEVISCEMRYQIGLKNPTSTVQEFLQVIANALQHYSGYNISTIEWNSNRRLWFSTEGIRGEALRFEKKGWQSGRLRLSIEFCPDEPEPELEAETPELPLLEASIEPADSPLDEIRRLAEE
jgi:hypothetical protein